MRALAGWWARLKADADKTDKNRGALRNYLSSELLLTFVVKLLMWLADGVAPIQYNSNHKQKIF